MTTSPDPIPLRLCVLTVSDSRTLAEDSSGDYLIAALEADGHRLHARTLLPDDRYRLRAVVSQWIADDAVDGVLRSEEHTSELQSLMRISYAVFCLKKKKILYSERITKT